MSYAGTVLDMINRMKANRNLQRKNNYFKNKNRYYKATAKVAKGKVFKELTEEEKLQIRQKLRRDRRWELLLGYIILVSGILTIGLFIWYFFGL